MLVHLLELNIEIVKSKKFFFEIKETELLIKIQLYIKITKIDQSIKGCVLGVPKITALLYFSGDDPDTDHPPRSNLLIFPSHLFLPNKLQLVTRAVRVIDLITLMDMSAFLSHGGWGRMLDRLKHEVSFCSKEAGGILSSELKPKKEKLPPTQLQVTAETDQVQLNEDAVGGGESSPMEMGQEEMDSTLIQVESSQLVEEIGSRDGVGVIEEREKGVVDGGCGLMCMPERAALIKSILNFLKKAIPEPNLVETIRTCACVCACVCGCVCVCVRAHLWV